MKCAKVVVIEDDQFIREGIRELLESEGYTVAAFANGKQAIEGLRDCAESCLILLDLMMPVMDGWEFLRARQTLSDMVVSIPVVIVSAVASGAQVQSAGVEGFLKKPIDINVLLQIVHEYCGKAAITLPGIDGTPAEKLAS